MNRSKKAPLPFRGVATALITPFRNNEVDIEAFLQQIDRQLAAGVDALVVTGTTGEAVTLDEGEKSALLEAAVERAGGRLPILAGTGSQSTKTARAAAKTAKEIGADALLVVTPYYNKGTKEGIITHYLEIAEETDLPLILYNVPSRTGVNLSLEQLAVLCEHPNIVGIKEASGDIDRGADIFAAFGEKLALYSGNDSQLLPILSLGGVGVISVLSNLFPSAAVRLCRLFTEGSVREAALLQKRLLPLTRLLFAETNPAPLKCAMAQLSLDSGELRLPLAPVPPPLATRIEEALRALPASLLP